MRGGRVEVHGTSYHAERLEKSHVEDLSFMLLTDSQGFSDGWTELEVWKKAPKRSLRFCSKGIG